MLEDPPILTLNERIERLPADRIDALRGVPTGVVADCMDGQGGLHHAIKPVGSNPAEFVATAVTCYCGPADNLAVFGALEIAQPGDAIVIATDGFLHTAVIGDLVAGMAANKGVVAIVTDGAVRDVAGINPTGVTCFAAGVTPNSPARNGPGTAGLPIQMGGNTISSGDVLVADSDGVVVVPKGLVSQVLETAPLIQAAEADLEAKVKAGLAMPDWAKALLADPRVRRV